MRNIYFIRHGKPDFPNGEKMCLGTTDIPLGPEGFGEARTLAAQLPPVTAVFSSPLLRAVQTAESLGQPVQTVPGLREYDMGQWDGLSFRDIRARYPDLYEARGADPTLRVPGQEDRDAGLRRFASAMEEVLSQSTGDIAVVTHGGVLTAFLESMGGKREKPGYAQVITLTYDSMFHFKEEDHA